MSATCAHCVRMAVFQLSGSLRVSIVIAMVPMNRPRVHLEVNSNSNGIDLPSLEDLPQVIAREQGSPNLCRGRKLGNVQLERELHRTHT